MRNLPSQSSYHPTVACREKRGHRRHPTWARAQTTTGWEVALSNISSGGACLGCAPRVLDGRDFELRMMIPWMPSFVARCRLARGASTSGGAQSCGVRFLAPSQSIDDAVLLSRLLDERLRLRTGVLLLHSPQSAYAQLADELRCAGHYVVSTMTLLTTVYTLLHEPEIRVLLIDESADRGAFQTMREHFVSEFAGLEVGVVMPRRLHQIMDWEAAASEVLVQGASGR